ncbi:MAG: N-acetyltransferase family protein [Nanoarchaeota archaeon]
MHIRTAGKADIPAVRAFFEAIGDDFYPPLRTRPAGDNLDTYINRSAKIIIAEDSGIIGGLMHSQFGLELHAELLGVAPGRRKGVVAYRLLEEAVHAYTGIARFVSAQTHEGNPAIDLYRHLGFRETGRAPDPVLNRTTVHLEASMQDLRQYFGVPEPGIPKRYIAAAACWVGAAATWFAYCVATGNTDLPNMMLY